VHIWGLQALPRGALPHMSCFAVLRHRYCVPACRVDELCTGDENVKHK